MIYLKQLYQDLTLAVSRPVALQRSNLVCAHTLIEKIDAWQQTIHHANSQTPALYHTDALEFCSALLACWQLGLSPIIPGNNLPDTLLALSSLGVDGYFGELAPQPTELDKSPRKTFSADSALAIFTSGSSGDACLIEKSFSQIDSELNALENQFGQTLDPKALFVGSVSHHHIYGLLFRLLWPLASRRLWQTQQQLYPELIEHNQEPLILITSPANLERLPQSLEPDGRHKNWQLVFSSGAPLSPEGAQACLEKTGFQATEIFGSSETGGIAWRHQLLEPLWQPLPGVDINSRANPDNSEQQLLAVESQTAGGFCLTTDIVEISNNRQGFLLKGRADSIVKVAGKRISLSQIARQLKTHPWVEDAKIIQLATRGNRLGAIIQLNKTGNRQLINSARSEFNEQLKQHVTSSVENVAIPRYWRYCDQLPCNIQGKSPLILLESLFLKQLPQHPEILQKTIDSTGEITAQLELYITANLSCFNGHFPGRPVLAGVVQLDWAIFYARQYLANLKGFTDLEAIKYQKIIGANQSVTLSLNIQTEKKKLYFRYHRGEQTLSSGRVQFTTVEPIEGPDNDGNI